MTRFRRAELGAGALEIAPMLLGAILAVREPAGDISRVRIVETEAYLPDDPASHAVRGPTPRNRSMFERPGTLYVYVAYGIHACANVVTDAPGVGSAVLLRAAQPAMGVASLRLRRPGAREVDLCRGPGRLTAALGIGPDDDGIDLITSHHVWLERGEPGHPIVRAPRVGITKATQRRWRFAIQGSPYVSSPRPA